LTFDSPVDLYVAAGERGDSYKVTPKGDHTVFFKSDEAHIRVLALDPKGNVIAGSDGSGLIYRISPSGDAFVLYSAPKKEITALAIDKEGNIYAAGAVEKRTGSAGNFSMPPPVINAPSAAPIVNISPAGAQPSSAPPLIMAPPVAFTATGGSEIYRIAPDGSPKRIWQSREELVYALTFDQRGR